MFEKSIISRDFWQIRHYLTKENWKNIGDIKVSVLQNDQEIEAFEGIHTYTNKRNKYAFNDNYAFFPTSILLFGNGHILIELYFELTQTASKLVYDCSFERFSWRKEVEGRS